LLVQKFLYDAVVSLISGLELTFCIDPTLAIRVKTPREFTVPLLYFLKRCSRGNAEKSIVLVVCHFDDELAAT
jgi:hypothetical protein